MSMSRPVQNSRLGLNWLINQGFESVMSPVLRFHGHWVEADLTSKPTTFNSLHFRKLRRIRLQGVVGDTSRQIS